MTKRALLLVVHPTRVEAISAAQKLVDLGSEVFDFYSVTDRKLNNVKNISQDAINEREIEIEIAVVLGGDGTILRAAEITRASAIPILGINLGHVGFLAQIEKPSLERLMELLRERRYTLDKRSLINYEVMREGKQVNAGFALNEVVIESAQPAMIELFVHVDDRPLSRWGCDGVLVATPTGSTAYAFSAGGPIIWPEVEAIVLLPLAAHALYSRPMVISPQSKVGVDIESEDVVLSADGLRTFNLQASDRINLFSSNEKISLAHIDTALFTDRLVAKFKLPVEGWREQE
jgi:NAD+ kinase